MANSKIYLGSTNIGSLFQGADDISIYLGDEKVYPLEEPVFQGKWLATYSDSHTESADCDASSAITQNEINGTDLVSVEIGDCVTEIGSGVFNGCAILTSCTIGNLVTNINQSLFYNCYALQSIYIPDSVTSIGDSTFRSCISLTSIDIPSGVTSIGASAFRSCSGLTSIDIPSGVTSIGGGAFNGCTILTSIVSNAVTPPTLGLNAFNNTNECPIYVPSGSVETYKTASRWSNYADRIQAIPNS